MKFGKQLAAQQVPVWAPFYIDYKGLKKIINSLAKGRPADAALLAAGFRPPFHAASAHGDPSSTLSNTIPVLEDAPVPYSDSNTSEIHAAATNAASNSSQPSFLPDNGESALLQAHRAAFFFKLERELEKINAFYLQKEAEMKSRMRALIDKRKTVQARLAGTLSRESAAFIALYEGLRYFERDLGKLQNYIEMNATGFRKILKKWDKRSKSTTKELYLARQVDVQPCFNRDVISELSDTASANVRKLEGLCIAKGGEQTLDPAADGILSERRAELAVANAEAQDDLLSNIENELLNAVKANDRSAVQNILASIPPLENLDKEMQSQLARIYWRAAIADQPGERAALDIARLDFQFVDDINGRTPLIEAAARGKDHLVRLCLERKVDIRHRDAYGREALHYGAMCSAEVCRCLIEHGTEANTVDYDGSTPLIHAISAGQLQCVEVLLSSLRNDPARSDSAQPMALAARLGHLPIVSLLLDYGYKMLPDASGYLPQHIAAKEGHVQVLQKLLEAGASVNAPDKFANWTSLFHAANEGHHQCVRILLHAGADLRAVDDQGKTAVHHAAWSGHPEIVSVLLAASSVKSTPDSTPKMSGGIAASRKRTVDDLSIEDSMDLDGDLIPDLSLPPPALPLRTYGHSYLDSKRCLVQLALGHPTTNAQSVPPIHFYRSDQLTSLKLVITSKSELHNVPHTIMLPLQDDAEVISMSVESLDNLTLELEVYPTFGSRLIGKAVCLPSIFSKIRGIEALTVPILGSHLNVIGELNFEMNAISHFNNVQLAIGGRLETYWKSVTSETPPKSKSWKSVAPAQDDLSFVTASSLTGEYVKLVVQVTRDGIPVTYPAWRLPIDNVDLHVSDVTWSQLSVMAEQAGRTLRTAPKAGSDSRLWYSALSNVIAPLQDVFQTCPPEVGLHIEVRYPTESDRSRLGIGDMLDVNVVIDSILNVVYANALGNVDRGMVRRMIFSSFSPVACGALNWKQPNYAVLFASYCGLSRSTPEGQLQPPHRTELDKRCTSIEGAVKFAKANNVLGLLLDATIMVPSLVESVKESGLFLGLFGNSAKALPHVDAWTAAEGVLSARQRDNDYV